MKAVNSESLAVTVDILGLHSEFFFSFFFLPLIVLLCFHGDSSFNKLVPVCMSESCAYLRWNTSI